MFVTVWGSVVDVGQAALQVELQFKAVGELHFVAASHLLAFDDELFGESFHYIAGDVAGDQGDGQSVGAFGFFPDAFVVELDDGAVAEQHFVLTAIDIGEVDDARGPVFLDQFGGGFGELFGVDDPLAATGIEAGSYHKDG